MNEFNYDDSAYLMHHGVKGMHWGVRKSKDSYRTGKTSGKVKKFIRKNGKRIAVGAGIATGAAVATGVGLGLATRKKKDTRIQNDPILTNRTMSEISPEAAENYIRYRKMKDQLHKYQAGAGDFHNFKR